MRVLRWIVWVVAGACAGTVAAQSPSTSEFDRAVAAAGREALAIGLRLRTDALWLNLLVARAPMMASLNGETCHIGYSAYHPRVDFSWLFPTLPSADRAAWLGGLVRHELAHCADMRDNQQFATDPRTTPYAASEPNGEVLADLAFALHVDGHSDHGDALIERLAGLRAARHATDPGHDSSDALRCYLAMRKSFASPTDNDWLTTLRSWRTRCLASHQGVEARQATDRRGPDGPAEWLGTAESSALLAR